MKKKDIDYLALVRKYNEEGYPRDFLPEDLHIASNQAKGQIFLDFFPYFSYNIQEKTYIKFIKSFNKSEVNPKEFLEEFENFKTILSDYYYTLLKNFLDSEEYKKKEEYIFFFWLEEHQKSQRDKFSSIYQNLLGVIPIFDDLLEYINNNEEVQNSRNFLKEDFNIFFSRQINYLKEIAVKRSTHENAKDNSAEGFNYEDGIIKPIPGKVNINFISDLKLGCPAVFLKVDSKYGKNLFDAIFNMTVEIFIEHFFQNVGIIKIKK